MPRIPMMPSWAVIGLVFLATGCGTGANGQVEPTPTVSNALETMAPATNTGEEIAITSGESGDGTAEAISTPPASTPVAADSAEVIVLRLGRAPSELAPGNDLVLHTITFTPGSNLAPHTHPGETIFHLTSGRLNFTLIEGEARLVRGVEGTPSAATPAATDALLTGVEIVLEAGDTLYYDASALQTERNDSDEDAVAVAIVINLRGEDEPRVIPHQASTPSGSSPVAVATPLQ